MSNDLCPLTFMHINTSAIKTLCKVNKGAIIVTLLLLLLNMDYSVADRVLTVETYIRKKS
jgi:hypothetical protein